MDTPRICTNCNGTNIEPGLLHSTGKLYFRPKDAKFFKFTTANVDVAASLCMDCGNLMLMADVEKAKALQGEKCLEMSKS